ncbi:ferrochelatase [bacterium]|nr:MAG: ferrochelatase [bacterium]
MPETIGVILLAFGGADSPEAVEPFMTNLMGGRRPPPELTAKIKARYDLIGGKSPLPEITRRQAAALEYLLNEKHAVARFRVVVGMRYWSPFIAEAVGVLAQAEIKKVVAISLAPFYSRVSTGAYEEEVRRVLAGAGYGMDVVFAGGWYDQPGFINAVADRVSAALEQFPEERRQSVQVIFSAHSLPVNHIEAGDPYVEQFKATSAGVAGQLWLADWHMAYQSKGGGQGEWLGPPVEEVMDELAAAGHKEVLVVPTGFVSDHIETLYDIDIAQKRHAEVRGLVFHRSEAPNVSPIFIEALAAVVLGSLKQ